MLIADPFSGVVIVLKTMAGNRKSTQKSRNYLQELLNYMQMRMLFYNNNICIYNIIVMAATPFSPSIFIITILNKNVVTAEDN